MKHFNKMRYDRLKKYKSREQFFVRMKNLGRPQQQETASSAEKRDDELIEIEVERTVLPGHAKDNLAAEETKNEEYTPQKSRRVHTVPKRFDDYFVCIDDDITLITLMYLLQPASQR